MSERHYKAAIDELNQQLAGTRADLVLATARAYAAEQILGAVHRALQTEVPPGAESEADWGARPSQPEEEGEPAGDVELGARIGQGNTGSAAAPPEVG